VNRLARRQLPLWGKQRGEEDEEEGGGVLGYVVNVYRSSEYNRRAVFLKLAK